MMRYLVAILFALLPAAAVAQRAELPVREVTMAGCLVGPALREKICGRAFFDSGAPGLRVLGGPRGTPWPDGTPAQIAFGDEKTVAAMPVVIGRRDQASGMFHVAGASVARLSSGLAPYFHWSVLYDAAHRTIGVRPR